LSISSFKRDHTNPWDVANTIPATIMHSSVKLKQTAQFYTLLEIMENYNVTFFYFDVEFHRIAVEGNG